MRVLKTTLTILLIAVLLIAAAVGLLWQKLLTPEQKLSYGLVFSALKDYEARTLKHPDDLDYRREYIDTLVRAGNLGRARYLSELHGNGHDGLVELTAAIDRALDTGHDEPVYALSDDPAVQAVAGQPVAEALRYLEAYQHALRGDWASAKNHFNAINSSKLAPELRPFHDYYLARSFIEDGTLREQRRVEELLLAVIDKFPASSLAARARYNLVAWYLGDGYPGDSPRTKALQQARTLELAPDHWATQKAYSAFAEHYRLRGEYKEAWGAATKALALDPTALPGKEAGELVRDILEAVISGDADWGLGETIPTTGKARLKAPLPERIFVDLARAGARHGYADSVARLLDEVKQHLTIKVDPADPGASSEPRKRWEEVRIGLAICFYANHETELMRLLMLDANLEYVSPATRGEIYYYHGLLLEGQGDRDKAQEYYRSSAQLASVRAGEANWRWYRLAKGRDTLLDPDRARRHLVAIVEDYPGTESFPRAVEELLPLLVLAGNTAEARQLAQWVLEIKPVEDPRTRHTLTHGGTLRTADGTREVAPLELPALDAQTLGPLKTVARFWLAYLAAGAGNVEPGFASDTVQVQYWNYYELMHTYPPQPGLVDGPLLLTAGKPDNAGEYLAGLGLLSAADEYYAHRGELDDPAYQYLLFANSNRADALPSRQWNATVQLESGLIRERPLLELMLAAAYPQPYATEIAAAAAGGPVDLWLVWAVMKKESNFKPGAVSSAGATGLMQLMPTTAGWLAELNGMDQANLDLTDPETNIRLGTLYLARLGEMFGYDNIRAIIHAYNGGDGNYKRWQREYTDNPVLLTELIPNQENEEFGKKVLRYWLVYKWLAGGDGGE